LTYLDAIATEIKRQISPEILPVENTRSLFYLYAVLALAKGTAVNAEDVHNAWVAWMLERDANHRSIKPFDELDLKTQASDEPFAEAIRKVAKRLNRHRA
jgi:hypothetical protein